MGRGSYSAGDWSRLKSTRKIGESSTEQLFSKRSLDPKYDPKNVFKREAFDNDEHPNSTPIMIGVDVTGSMGYLSTKIIKESLNELMMKLYASEYIKDPQLLFAAIGDAVCDSAPLQVTQFESDIRIAEQLLDLWLENSGGDLPEDYELLWYFAAFHTEIDSLKKRGQKGFCFTIGDASCHSELKKESIARIFGDSSKNFTSAELANEASKKYELFHIMIGNRGNNFAEFIPGRVVSIAKSDIDYLPELIISLMQLTNNVSPSDILNQWGELARPVVAKALNEVKISGDEGFSF